MTIRPSTATARTGLFLLLSCVLLAGCATAPQATADLPFVEGTPSATLLAVRRAKSDPAVNYLTYQHMDQLFGVSRLTASPRPTPIAGRAHWSSGDFRLSTGGTTDSFDTFLERHRMNAIVVLKDGKIVKETYRNGSGPATPFIGYSMSKSVIAMLIGIAIQEGRIKSVNDPIVQYLPELKGTGYDPVTVRNLLMMRAGTDWKEIYTPGSELDRHRDQSLNEAKVYYEDYAFKAKSLLPPGTRFNYSTLDTNLAGWLLERAVGMPLSTYMATRLWHPMGAEADAYWVNQGPGQAQRPFYGAGMAASLRDWARIGQVALDDGRAQGAQLVPAAWMKESTSRLNDQPGYGYFWWTIGEKGYGALGVNGQAIYVQPATRVVIAVAGYWKGATDDTLSAERTAFFEAVAASVAKGGR
ncbi:serine hydrolase [Variovorax paradoxus]|uniref:serine hydrolase domain-containing protein n=1 Tax=Variovorax paradoxus TaxID=34073 RepID=UPI003ECE0A3C